VCGVRFLCFFSGCVVQGCSSPLVVKIADTEKEKNAKRLQGAINTGNMGFGGLVAMAPLEMAACYQVGVHDKVSKN